MRLVKHSARLFLFKRGLKMESGPILLLLVAYIVQATLALQYTPHRVFKYQGDDDPGQPLILTPYIQNGQIDQGISYASIVMLSLLYVL